MALQMPQNQGAMKAKPVWMVELQKPRRHNVQDSSSVELSTPNGESAIIGDARRLDDWTASLLINTGASV